ncbi:MAG: SCO family protein [Robiginitomaculum sp.]|nr:SCO family protein [Robiginitomaculum sp.]
MSRVIFKQVVAVLGLGAAFMVLGACSGDRKPDGRPSGQVAQSGQVTAVSGKADIGGAYELVDHTGKPVTNKNYLGKAQLIFFGFAYCPDVCPTALQKMGAALELAGDAGDAYQAIFITVDPKRDTPEMLAQFVTANGFPAGLVALTGTQAQIDKAKKAFKVYGAKADDPTSAAGYTFDHTSLIYMMDENGDFVDIFSHSTSPQDIADRLVRHSDAKR